MKLNGLVLYTARGAVFFTNQNYEFTTTPPCLVPRTGNTEPEATALQPHLLSTF